MASSKRGKRSGLGRGLGALIPPEASEGDAKRERPVDVLFPERTKGSSAVHADAMRGGSAKDLLNPRKQRTEKSDDSELIQVPGASFALLPVSEVVANRKQPRQVFDDGDLAELAESIRQVGVLQPVVVRRVDEAASGEAQFELVMGERRLRAAGMAGLTEIPAIVRSADESNLLRDALLENLHRAELNPLEEAAAYEQLLNDFDCTQEELSARIARSRPQIANTLRLLRLPPKVQRRVAAGVLSAGHARALLGLTDSAEMERLAERIVSEGLSVRATEELVRHGKNKATPRKPRGVTEPSELATKVAESMADFLDTRVVVSEGKKTGKIVITFADKEDLARIAKALTEPDPYA